MWGKRDLNPREADYEGGGIPNYQISTNRYEHHNK